MLIEQLIRTAAHSNSAGLPLPSPTGRGIPPRTRYYRTVRRASSGEFERVRTAARERREEDADADANGLRSLK